MKNKTALIVVYFGPAPDFINLFFKGCQYNEDIEFLFFTDWDGSLFPMLHNVKYIPFTLEKFNRLATKKCGIEINVNNGYKLCDLKPAWAHILEDYISDYEFVGYCDIDLIFGHINSFFSEEVRNHVDLFTITTQYLSGALTIFRNNSKMRELYRKAIGWDYIFQDARHFAFDEFLRIEKDRYVGMPDNKGAGKLQSFSDLVFSMPDLSLSNEKYIGYEKRPGLVTFDRGRIYADGNEYIFFHYVVAKQSVFWTIPNWAIVPDQFSINKYGFYQFGSRAVGFADLLCNSVYRAQLVSSVQKKGETIKRLIKECNIKLMFNSVLKQFK